MKNNGILKTIRTTVLKCDTPTITGRVYPLDLIKKSLKNDKVLQERLATKTFFGELGYPIDRTEANLSKVAFNVEKLYWYKNELKAVIAILDTPDGRMLNQILSKVKFTTCGTGDIDLNKTITNYQLNMIAAAHRLEASNEK